MYKRLGKGRNGMVGSKNVSFQIEKKEKETEIG